MYTQRHCAHLQRQQKQECLDAVEASVDKVAHEQIVGVGHVAAHLKQLLQIIELTVNVAADLRTPPHSVSMVHGGDTDRSPAVRALSRVRAKADCPIYFLPFES